MKVLKIITGDTLRIEEPQTYRNYIIEPNPDYARDYKYRYTHIDYDGPEDTRRGDCETLEECVEEIDELETETP